MLGENVEEKDEYYRFTWAGKNQARLEANKPTTATLRPNKADSKDWDTTSNIFIEGDNLEVLKLLQKSYANKIKMIYIDPPYNTGKDFVYKDNYADNLGNYLELTGQLDESGKKISTNTESDGRYHSNWLNMMYPRLRLARNLMTDDGVIFISIDDNEVHNLRKLCDEIFGEDNLIAQICHKARASVSNDKIISSNHNHILFYAKAKNVIFDNRKNIGLKPNLEGFDKSDENGFYKLVPVDGPGGAKKGNPHYEFEGITGYWRFSKERMTEMFKNGQVVKTTNNLQQKYYLSDAKNSRRTATTWWDENLYTSTATARLKTLLGSNAFDTPKPIELLEKMLELSNTQNSLILDFFAGSGTTAHAVMQLNAEDGGNRKCISVQLPEPTDEKSEAFKAGYATIAEITKERIRRAGEKIKQDFKDKEGIEKLDVGFKAFKLDSSNIVAWDGNPDKLAEQLDAFANNIKTDRTEEDILFEILLKYGLDLTVAIEEKTIAGQKVYSVGLGTLFICLANTITPEISEGIGAWKQELAPTRCRVIYKDTGFNSDKDKVNAMQILKRFGVEEVNSI
ncbi:site-specific DNA-methyltransferase [Flavobacterium fontis]|uniref:site-specific DNA-methyltransferase n=1 Tax=Flavobacterium fontis TaxID=1124188 RepID=UPI001F24B3E6|nr:site-specific DNA-methyltransferase [Flavobacterium fontis]